MKYRIYGKFKGDTKYYLQVETQKPAKSLVASKFIWVSVLCHPSTFERLEDTLSWFKMLATKNEHWEILTIEKISCID